jgi:hypothetical protein
VTTVEIINGVLYMEHKKDEWYPVAFVRIGPALFHSGLSLILDACPLCGKQHRHGYSSEQNSTYGLRPIHCAHPGRIDEYLLVEEIHRERLLEQAK